MSTNLNFITGNALIAQRRKENRADLVALLEPESNLGSACGIAWRPSLPINTNSYTNGFSVSNGRCAQIQYTFPHELGHNFGLLHDRHVSGNNNRAADCGFGYFVFENWSGSSPTAQSITARTVMSYADYCTANGMTCTRTYYYSNTFMNEQTRWVGRDCSMQSTNQIMGSADNSYFFQQSSDVVSRYHLVLP